LKELRKYYNFRKYYICLLFSVNCFGGEFVRIYLDPIASLFACLFGCTADEFEKEGMVGMDGLLRQIRRSFYDSSFDTRLPFSETVVKYLIVHKKLKIGNKDYSVDLRQLIPLYEKIFERKLKLLRRKRLEITKSYSQCHIDIWLPKIMKFYGSDLSLARELPFNVFLFPLFSSDRGFSFPVGNRLLFLQALPESGDTHAGIITHEICHVFYKTMSSEQKQMFQNFFKKEKSNSAQLAKHYLDESLATSIGNRFVVNDANKKYSRGAYNEEYIDKYSEVLLALVAEYLTEGKTIDKLFLKKAVQIFEQTFPNASSDYNMLFFAPKIFSNFSESDVVEQILSVFFSTEIQVFTLDRINSTTKNEYETIKLVIVKNSTNIPGVTLKKQPDTLCVKKNKDKIFVVIQTDELEKIKKALRFLKNQKVLRFSFLYQL
jgi:hypothetical protein